MRSRGAETVQLRVDIPREIATVGRRYAVAAGIRLWIAQRIAAQTGSHR